MRNPPSGSEQTFRALAECGVFRPRNTTGGAGIPQEYPGGIAPTYVYPQGYMYKCAYGVFKNTVEVLNKICQR